MSKPKKKAVLGSDALKRKLAPKLQVRAASDSQRNFAGAVKLCARSPRDHINFETATGAMLMVMEQSTSRAQRAAWEERGSAYLEQLGCDATEQPYIDTVEMVVKVRDVAAEDLATLAAKGLRGRRGRDGTRVYEGWAAEAAVRPLVDRLGGTITIIDQLPVRVGPATHAEAGEDEVEGTSSPDTAPQEREEALQKETEEHKLLVAGSNVERPLLSTTADEESSGSEPEPQAQQDNMEEPALGDGNAVLVLDLTADLDPPELASPSLQVVTGDEAIPVACELSKNSYPQHRLRPGFTRAPQGTTSPSNVYSSTIVRDVHQRLGSTAPNQNDKAVKPIVSGMDGASLA